MPLGPPRLEDVTLLDPYLVNAEAKTHAYLLELDPERLLFSFYRRAGLEPATTEGYGGWEREEGTRFQGHFFGHAISAWSQAYATTDDDRFAARIETAVRGLETCQRAYALAHPEDAGYVSAFGVEALPSGADGLLVPFYNLHKVLAGLLDAQRYAPSETGATALAVAAAFGTWIARYAAALPDAGIILDTEYGGMNEALYRLYALTGDPVHREAAERFDEVSLFRELAAGTDRLAGRHANTTIPKLIGALARYTVLSARTDLDPADRAGLEMYRAAAENFWQIVVDHHTYANGANSQSEHFHAPGTLHARATNGSTTGYGENSTAEGCNEYNMLKLTRALFALTGDAKYSDYDEGTFVNSILASQNPETGMVTYFQPQRAGYAKVFGRPFDQFWCDHGTGIESFTKLAEGIYSTGGDGIRVNAFFSSELRSAEHGVRVTMTADVPREDVVRIRVEALGDATDVGPVPLRLRVPGWVDGDPVLLVNGTSVPVMGGAGDIAVAVEPGDEIEYRVPAGIRISAETEADDWVAFLYGPVLLATELSRENVDASYTAGVLVEMGVADPSLTGVVRVEDADAWRSGIRDNLVRLADGEDAHGRSTIRFAMRGVDEASAELAWVPYYSLYGARYATYVTLFDASDPMDEVSGRDDVIDALTSFDNNNSEADKNHRFHRSTVGVRDGAQYRSAAGEGAFFSYDLIVDPAVANVLRVRFSGQDAGDAVDILMNDVVVAQEVVEGGGLYDRDIAIPRVLLDGIAGSESYKRDQHGGFTTDAEGERIPVVTVCFRSVGSGAVGGVFGVWTVRDV